MNSFLYSKQRIKIKLSYFFLFHMILRFKSIALYFRTGNDYLLKAKMKFEHEHFFRNLAKYDTLKIYCWKLSVVLVTDAISLRKITHICCHTEQKRLTTEKISLLKFSLMEIRIRNISREIIMDALEKK